jgi:hypothetical protein
MQPLDPRIERIAHSGMFSVFSPEDGYNRFDTLEGAQSFLAHRDLEEAFDGQFLQPEIVGPETFQLSQDGCWVPQYSGGSMTEETAHGYFARLSASGYLDCTEWGGPFETEAEAARYLLDTYAND